MLERILLISVAVILTSCGGGGGGSGSGGGGNPNPGSTTGTVTLSGADTTLVGIQLNTGFVGASPAAGSQPDYIIIVDKASTVSFTAPNILTPNITDPNNAFILVVTDASVSSGFKGISMSIIANSTKYDYACTTPVSTFIECGFDAIKLDITNKKVTFNNTVVTNVTSSTVLTLNGVLTW